MQRKGPGRFFGKKRPTGQGKKTNSGNESIHRRNIRIFSFPVILAFQIIRYVAFHIWLLLLLLYRAGRYTVTTRLSISQRDSQRPLLRMTHNPKAISVGPGEPALARQKRHHRKAFEYISKALKVDEEDKVHKEQAIELYKRGIDELERGIAVDVSGTGEVWERARRLQGKMEANLTMAKDRLEVLDALVKGESAPAKADVSDLGGENRFCGTGTSDGARPKVTGRAVSHRKKPLTMTNKSYTLPRCYSTPSSAKTTPTVSPRQSPRPTRKGSQPNLAPNKENKAKLSKGSTMSRLKNVDKKLAHCIMDEIIDSGPAVQFRDIAGQEIAKQALQEIVILPALRPEIFTGLRAPARGLLLFGPPGNGKTMLVGEGEKMVRALFAIARELQPAIIFIDEIDSLLCERREGEHEASRRLKTEFLLEFDGLHGSGEEKILVMGATNRPQELDDAALRRFPKRIYVTMPSQSTRKVLLNKLLAKNSNPLTESDEEQLSRLTEGYSGSDLTALAKDAALGPIRDLNPDEVKEMDVTKVREISISDFKDSLKKIRRSVPPETLKKYEDWNVEYGDITT